LEKSGGYHDDKLIIIGSSYTIVYPFAMMIKVLTTSIAIFAMFSVFLDISFTNITI